MKAARPASIVGGSVLLALTGLACAPSGTSTAGPAAGASPIQSGQRVDSAWAEPSDHAAHMVDAAATLGLSLEGFSQLFQVFDRELRGATDTSTTPAQREYVGHLAKARDVYQDLISFWQMARGEQQHDIWSGPTVIGSGGDRNVDVVALANRYHITLEEAPEPNVKVLPHQAIQRLKTLAYDEMIAAHVLARP